MNGDIVPNEKLWTKDITKRYKDGTHWSLLRTKEDRRTKERYFDVLVGLRGKKPHAHLGINLNQTLRFSKFRKTTHSVGRTVVSEKKGLLENKAIVVDNDVKGGKQLVFKLTVIGQTAEVTVDEFKLV